VTGWSSSVASTSYSTSVDDTRTRQKSQGTPQPLPPHIRPGVARRRAATVSRPLRSSCTGVVRSTGWSADADPFISPYLAAVRCCWTAKSARICSGAAIAASKYDNSVFSLTHCNAGLPPRRRQAFGYHNCLFEHVFSFACPGHFRYFYARSKRLTRSNGLSPLLQRYSLSGFRNVARISIRNSRVWSFSVALKLRAGRSAWRARRCGRHRSGLAVAAGSGSNSARIGAALAASGRRNRRPRFGAVAVMGASFHESAPGPSRVSFRLCCRRPPPERLFTSGAC
jgi:hypothetical protein